MSIQLPTIDLSTAIVGSTGNVVLPQPKVQVGELGHLRLYNESGCGLDILFNNGHGEVIPAGAWPMFEIEPEVLSYTWKVTYVLPNAPVSTMKGVYYFPYEGVPPTPALGNSPIGVTGNVSTSSVQTLSNELGAANTQVIDIGDAALANLWRIFTDHFTIKVDQSSVAHTVLTGATSGNPLQLGQVGDITEVLGNLTIDGMSIHTGASTFTGTDTHNGLIAPANAGTAHAGSVGGTLTFYTPIWGASLKILLMTSNAYNSASTFTFIFPNAMTFGFFATGSGSDMTYSFNLSGGGSATESDITALSSSGGTSSPVTTFPANGIGQIIANVDRIVVSATTGAHTNFAFMIGV